MAANGFLSCIEQESKEISVAHKDAQTFRAAVSAILLLGPAALSDLNKISSKAVFP
jgi:hypothetical protein